MSDLSAAIGWVIEVSEKLRESEDTLTQAIRSGDPEAIVQAALRWQENLDESA